MNNIEKDIIKLYKKCMAQNKSMEYTFEFISEVLDTDYDTIVDIILNALQENRTLTANQRNILDLAVDNTLKRRDVLNMYRKLEVTDPNKCATKAISRLIDSRWLRRIKVGQYKVLSKAESL